MKELTEFLKAERSKRNLTLESVSERSGISAFMLDAFESGDFERFGASILIRNTIAAYCKVLQIDSGPLIDKFASEIEKYNTQDRGIKKYGRQMKILRKRRRMISLPLLVLAVMSAVVFYGGMWVTDKRSRMYAPPAPDRILTQEELPAELQRKLGTAARTGSVEPWRQGGTSALGPVVHGGNPVTGPRDADNAIRNAETHLNEAEKVKEDQKAREAELAKQVAGDREREVGAPRLALSNSTEAVAEDRAVPASEPLHKNKLAVEADDRVWIQVRIDDKGPLSTMLRPGDRMEWIAEKSMQVVVGNAGGIRMKWNDQPLPVPRDPGRVLRFRLPDYVRTEG